MMIMNLRKGETCMKHIPVIILFVFLGLLFSSIGASAPRSTSPNEIHLKY